jgi:hypothetical protein
LHRIDVGAPAAVELVLDHVEQPPVQSLDQGQGLEIERLDLFEARLTIGALRHVCYRFHFDALHDVDVFMPDEAPVPRPTLGNLA